jgi:2-amino-4-hydroxy-6-hydroxymethyldihydropteridine diphosphokinase
MSHQDAFIALGSNRGARARHLQEGLLQLAHAGHLLAASAVWETEPIDAPGPSWFLNMVVALRTTLGPFELLDTLLAIERRAGRTREIPRAPRTLDLDLLLFGDLAVQTPRLQLPHPRMWQRRFVLEPLAEIAPGLVNPATGRTVLEERACIAGLGAVRRLGRLA